MRHVPRRACADRARQLERDQRSRAVPEECDVLVRERGDLASEVGDDRVEGPPRWFRVTALASGKPDAVHRDLVPECFSPEAKRGGPTTCPRDAYESRPSTTQARAPIDQTRRGRCRIHA